MTDAILLDNAAGSYGRLILSGVTFYGPIPPQSGEMIDRYNALIAEGVTPTPYTAPAPAMPDISDRQFGRGLWGAGIISYADFLGFIGPGTLPTAIQNILSMLPDDSTGNPTPRKEATGFLTGAKTFQFAHPLVETFREAMAASDAKWTPDYLRTEWLAWSAL